MPQTQFQNWVKPLRMIRCDDRALVLGVPSRFHEEWLKSHYAEQLREAIQRQCGSPLQLEFEILAAEPASENARAPEAPAAPTARPHLRIVEKTDAAPETQKEEAPAEPDSSSPPPTFSQPYFELPFNFMATQCMQMMAQGHRNVNPLIIQADVGMGKTHLLSELGVRLKAKNPQLRIRYTTGEAFTAEMFMAIKNDRMMAFKKKYREDTDVLLFDDLQVMAKKIRTQEELLHIFNDLMAKGGQIAFATSIAPQKLEDFVQPLRSRILSAVIGEVATPSFEDRVKLLAKMCEHNRIFLEPSVLPSLADKGQKDIRELIGSLLRAHLHSTIENKPLDHQYLAKDGWIEESHKQAVTLEEIIALVEHNFSISRTELASKSRKSITTWARQVAMYLARHFTLLPLEQIGKTFGRDHATVIHAFQKVTETMDQHPTRRYQVEFLMQKLQNHSGQNHFGDRPTDDNVFV